MSCHVIHTCGRGEAMQAASDATDGSMVSVIGLKAENVQDICDAAAKQSGEPVQVITEYRYSENCFHSRNM